MNTFVIKILIIGNSLTQGHGVPQEQCYPAIVEQKLKDEGHRIKIVSDGISGSVSSSALPRYKEATKNYSPHIVLLELGANDGLQGIPIVAIFKNLQKAIVKMKQDSRLVLLAGMKIPPENYGKKYAKAFEEIYTRLSEKYDTSLIPFLLKDVGQRPEFNQEDNLHPNAKGQKIMAQTVYKYLVPMLKKIKSKG